MYQVITMYGDNEPWWFFEGWENDIQEETNFWSLDDAKLFFQEKWDLICNHYTYINSKTNFLSAFWNDGEERWCEECDDDLQQYKGLALLENYQPITIESERKFYEATNSSGKAKRCQRPGQSIRS
ncbi:DUF1033 domain-containing protein [Tetragenococcus halophilus]|uniref:DUF1033 domain-containing protein n=1 Tax=Tetragenococcus halophilus TaxID=51669 RepID=A0A3G5FM53_TETHA|nr:DUF1033 family protein [Tetragenococcus halophilus]AYW51341.1 DUF1033 domain-containing protein [Tetragenococcus halophilus]GBD63548.1 putative uncharacterized protein [Tetragenococcus halophilus subsp. flandriensis]